MSAIRIVAMIALASTIVRAQSSEERLRFDVASVKQNKNS